MLTALDGLIDLDQFYKFWAVETMLDHWDGYGGNNNNFFLYGNPADGKFNFLPWGIDQLFVEQVAPLDSALTRSTLTRRLFLHPPARARYIELYGQVLDSAWDESAILADVSRMASLIEESVPVAKRTEFQNAVSALRLTLTGREALLRSNGTNSSVDDAESLADPLCFDEAGGADLTFTASYNGGAQTSATIDLTVPSGARPITDLIVVAGPDEEDSSKSVLIFIGKDPSNKDALLFVTLPRDQVMPGTLEIGKGLVESFLLFTPDGASEPDELYFLSGTLTTSVGAPANGTNWTGSLDLTGWSSPIFSGGKGLPNAKRSNSQFARQLNSNAAATKHRADLFQRLARKRLRLKEAGQLPASRRERPGLQQTR